MWNGSWVARAGSLVCVGVFVIVFEAFGATMLGMRILLFWKRGLFATSRRLKGTGL